jgi:hypothetical protein
VLGSRSTGLAILIALLLNWAVNLATGAAFH